MNTYFCLSFFFFLYKSEMVIQKMYNYIGKIEVPGSHCRQIHFTIPHQDLLQEKNFWQLAILLMVLDIRNWVLHPNPKTNGLLDDNYLPQALRQWVSKGMKNQESLPCKYPVTQGILPNIFQIIVCRSNRYHSSSALFLIDESYLFICKT